MLRKYEEFRINYEKNKKRLKKKYKRLKTRYFLLFVLPIFLIVVAFQTGKELLKRKAKAVQKQTAPAAQEPCVRESVSENEDVSC